MRLYTVGGKSEFPVNGGPQVVSYLVSTDGFNHFSFGFDPEKKTIEEACKEFRQFLDSYFRERAGTDRCEGQRDHSVERG